ncbi:MAG: AraC family transcriptional regulator [Rariglobus sp.]|jgi:AraC-like DNA-binding protein|nr:AraC family transcriptional regulator [Rariglobus sp.]
MANQHLEHSKLDFYGLQPRLIWANERTLAQHFLDMNTTAAADETVAWFIKQGEVTVSYGRGVAAHAGVGEWLLLRAENGRQHFTPGTRLISLRFHLRLRGGKPLFARPRDVVVTGARAERLQQAARNLVEEFERVDAPETVFVARDRIKIVDNFRIEAAFMHWLGRYVDAMLQAGEKPEAVSNRDHRVTKALIWIEDHSMREKFSEAELARRCGLGINQLGRLFRSEQGMSPFQYYEERRMELARHALTDSSLPIKEISFELGFSSSPHFSNWFNARAGMSPRAWRTKKRKG